MLRGKKIIVVGLGITGLSCIRWLVHKGARLAVADSRTEPPGLLDFQTAYPAIPVYAGPLEAELLQTCDMIVRSPGVSQYEPALLAAKAAGVPIVGDIELFARHIAHWPARVIAITGSNGKSTVTTMVGDMVRKAGFSAVVAGNIGTPVLDTLLAIETGEATRPDIFVLELSSFQLETTYSLNPVAATVLNISEDHLDRYQDLEDYARTKARVFQGNGVMLLNRQDTFSPAMVRQGRTVRWFGQDAPRNEDEYGLEEINGEYVLRHGTQTLLPMNALTVAGLHNAANALAAIALCRAAGMPLAPLTEALQAFCGLKHRVEKVAQIDGVTYFDDSKGTNVGATEAALKGMTQPVLLIAGGQGKGQDFSPLKAACAAHCRLVLLIGQDAAQIAAALEGGVPSINCKTLEEAVFAAAQHAQSGDIVLLSPACASLDMFRDYKHRGAAFVAAVQRLKAET